MSIVRTFTQKNEQCETISTDDRMNQFNENSTIRLCVYLCEFVSVYIVFGRSEMSNFDFNTFSFSLFLFLLLFFGALLHRRVHHF